MSDTNKPALPELYLPDWVEDISPTSYWYTDARIRLYINPNDKTGLSRIYTQADLDAAILAERERCVRDAASWGSALNAASWAQLDAYRKYMGEVESVKFFNMGKSILRDSIAAYFEALDRASIRKEPT